MSAGPRSDGPPRHFGLYPAIVTDLVDPDTLGRIQVKLPWLGSDGSDVRAWATLLTPYADDDQGFEALPEAAAKPNNKRLIKSREKSLLEFDDTSGAVRVTLSTQSGHQLVLDAGAMEIKITHSSGPTITMDAAGNVKINANVNVDLTGSVLNVHAPVANFDGIINCQTMIASVGVVSPSYTPGAGNVW